MKLEPVESAEDSYLVEKYDSHTLTVKGHVFSHNVVLFPKEMPRLWSVNVWTDINREHVDELLAYRPDIVLFGSGAQQLFLPARLTAKCWQKNIGCEVMNTSAACRTYNFLLQEGRFVIAALLVG